MVANVKSLSSYYFLCCSLLLLLLLLPGICLCAGGSSTLAFSSTFSPTSVGSHATLRDGTLGPALSLAAWLLLPLLASLHVVAFCGSACRSAQSFSLSLGSLVLLSASASVLTSVIFVWWFQAAFTRWWRSSYSFILLFSFSSLSLSLRLRASALASASFSCPSSTSRLLACSSSTIASFSASLVHMAEAGNASISSFPCVWASSASSRLMQSDVLSSLLFSALVLSTSASVLASVLACFGFSKAPRTASCSASVFQPLAESHALFFAYISACPLHVCLSLGFC
ncbi:hypothetical protein JZ751_003470 [Albula glossodonta]|uniref:NADH dehydrogenase subunit 5 n=1 Tax=Albula glossodonta TaxID=121402 RepID=A0A8T2N6J0_9TELE|nr:hypothetical protein JZ751_003470 [Albula glossodonta]